MTKQNSGVRAVLSGVAVGVALAAGAASVAAAQDREADTTRLKERSNLSIMEGVLERAVRVGADNLNRLVRSVSPQDPPLLLAGSADARGFRLEGYGLFFDVQVPVLRQSITWMLRSLMDQNSVPLHSAILQLRSFVRSIPDPGTRQSVELALRRIEMQVGVPEPLTGDPRTGPGASTVAATSVVPGAAAASARPAETVPPAALEWLNDPSGVYTTEVKNAIVDAMLEHSGALGVGPGEWLTVAARDNERPDRLNPSDELSTIMLRISGRDLAELRAGRLTAEEARERVEIREY
ncbi:MAG: hypothetical protein FJW23_15525 [Acidimicrobiia bacterium]|nr:hypothetical protein [Acidimicrobiia bacterium]